MIHLRREEVAYVDEIGRSGQGAHGPLTRELERSAARALGGRHAIAVSHGTAALHLALLSLDVGAGDEVIAPSYACAALLHAIHYTGATPVLVDIDPHTLNPTAEMVSHRLTPRTKAAIVTHTFGFPADVASIARLGVAVVEDCAQALGARYRGRPVGSWGRVAVCSFYATKMICAGEGGMVATNDARIAARVRDLSTPDLQPRYRVRYNYKLSDLAAGLALSQLRQLNGFVERRRAIAQRYIDALADFSVQLQRPLAGAEPVFYRFVVSVP
ncbi:MAG: DegT/DnrJ/EryC1/StrS aminotransferase family protein, partial [Chloroflexi bacterium]|nr:DegT/DnrJ/EryC1/StrS aminotransferase family protein [Chloroflexota bacterium]